MTTGFEDSGIPAEPEAAPPRWFDAGTLWIGLGAGLLNGLIGLGGGILIVPGLILRRKVEVRVAVSTSLGAVMVLSFVSFALHVSFTGYTLSLAGSVLVIASGMAAAQLGGWLLNRLPRRAVLLAFATITVLTASHLIVQALGLVGSPAPSPEGPPLWSYPLFGTVSGLFSGLLGVGGGGWVVLGFTVFFQTPVQGGLPIALALNVTNALSGVWAQRKSGQILWREVGRLIPAALVGIALGSTLAMTLPADALRMIFGAFFLFMAGRMYLHALRR